MCLRHRLSISLRVRFTISIMNRFLLALLAVPLASAQVELEFQAPDASYIAALPLRNGKRLLVGTATRVEGTSQLVVGNARYGGSGNMVPSAALLDSAGNIWIAGDTDSEEFEEGSAWDH